MINKRLLISGGSIANILSYSVTPSSIPGTSSSTLTHSVTGEVGATFTLNVTGGTIHTMGPGGIFSTTSNQSSQGTGAGARTLTYTATNSLDPINTLTDTVSQGAGTAAVYPTFSAALSASPNTTTYSNGSTHTLSSSVNFTVTAAGNTRPTFQGGGVAASQVVSYSVTFARNGSVTYTNNRRSGYAGYSAGMLPVGTVVTVSITITTTDDGMNPTGAYPINSILHRYSAQGYPSFVSKQWNLV